MHTRTHAYTHAYTHTHECRHTRAHTLPIPTLSPLDMQGSQRRRGHNSRRMWTCRRERCSYHMKALHTTITQHTHNTHTNARTHTCTHTHTHECTHTHIHSYTHVHTHTLIHTHMYTHTYLPPHLIAWMLMMVLRTCRGRGRGGGVKDIREGGSQTVYPVHAQP